MLPFSKIENFLAAGLILFFLLPWAQLFGQSVSGFNLTELGSYGTLPWLMPILGATIIGMGLLGVSTKVIGIVTGSLPFLGLLYAIGKLGTELFHVMGIGAYLTLVCGGAMILASLDVIAMPEHLASGEAKIDGGRVLKEAGEALGPLVGPLFDFSFSTRLTPSLMRPAYGLCLALGGVLAIWLIVLGFDKSSGMGLLMLLVVGPLVFGFFAVIARVLLETVNSVSRLLQLAEDTEGRKDDRGNT